MPRDAERISASRPSCLDAGVALECLGGGETTVFEASRAGHTNGFMMLHRGSIVAELYDNGLRPGAQHLIFSVSKSIAGTLGSILADQGKLDPEVPCRPASPS